VEASDIMHKQRWILLIVAVVLALAVILAAIFWPWVRLWLPHPSLVTAWLRYLVIDLNIGRWGPVATLLLVAIIELVWALNLGRRSSAFDRQWTRLERMHARELEVLSQTVALLKEEQRALRGELELCEDLIGEEKARLWSRLETLHRVAGLPWEQPGGTHPTSGILRSRLVQPQAASLPSDVRDEWRQIISQLEHIDTISSASGRKVKTALQAQQHTDELLRLGSACYHLGQHERALRHYTKAADLAAVDPAVLVNRAVVNQELLRLQSALQDLDRVLKSEENAWAYLYRGLVREQLGEAKRALEDYGRAIRLDGGLTEAYYRRGLLFAELSEQDKAFQDQNRVLELQPRHAAAFTARGVARAALGESQWALNDLDRGCSLAPTSYWAFYRRGQVCVRLQMYDEALADLEQAIELEPSFAAAFLARGEAYLQTGQPGLAVADYDRAIALQPKNPAAYRARGQARAAMREYRHAVEDYDHALDLDPGDVHVLACRGSAREKVGEYAEAIHDLDRAIALDPNLASAYYNRGLAYGNLGEYDRASRDLNKAVELDPSISDQAQASPGLVAG
jgi:tetratricopeptide (TPR) repeat protein